MTAVPWRNWSGAVRAAPEAVQTPASQEALAQVMAAAPPPVRAVGSGHSCTPLAATAATQVRLNAMTGIISHDSCARTARVLPGTTVRALGPALAARGLALLNQGDIDAQTIAGAVATGTHGTGETLGSLSAAVAALRLVTASGDVLVCDREHNPDVFHAARVSFGSLGIMSEITLQCRLPYVLRQQAGRMSLEALLPRLEEFCAANRHFEFFWFPCADEVLIKTLNETTASPRPSRRPPRPVDTPEDRVLRWACRAVRAAPALRGPLQRFLTRFAGRRWAGQDGRGRVRASHEAFPSDRNVRFNEMEYAVPARHGPACLQEVGEYLRTCGHGFMFPVEYRTVAADDAWLSPFHGRNSATIAVHQYAPAPHEPLFRGAQEIFRRYGGRPHWGKWHSLKAADLAPLYPRWNDFLKVRAQLDPEGRLLNPYLREVLLPEA